jgi:hypothetical protein
VESRGANHVEGFSRSLGPEKNVRFFVGSV